MTRRYTEDHPDVVEWLEALAQWRVDCRNERYVKTPVRPGKHFRICGNAHETWYELASDDFAPEQMGTP